VELALFIVAVITAILALTFSFGYLMSFRRELRLVRLAKARASIDGYAELKRSIPDLPDDWGRQIYRSFQRIVRSDFPLLPDDEIWKTLDVDAGNLENMIENLLEESKRMYPPDEPQSPSPFRTVRDVVVFLNACPAISSAREA
jgi:hypothetical protein